MPTKEQIARFIKCFDILSSFDAQQTIVRGYGAGFDEKEWPDRPDDDVIAVYNWLRELSQL